METKANPKIIEKIPFFRKLSTNQIGQLLHVGQMSTFQSGKVLCKDGDKSTEMFILLSGELAIKDGGVELARVKPVEVVGEMGVITNEPRCATIEVVNDAALMTIGKMQFDVLLRNDVDMAAKIYKNMVDAICQRLRENNAQLSRVLAQANIAASAM